MRRILLVALAGLFVQAGFSQDAFQYQTPPKDIVDLALARPTPSVSINGKGTWMLMMERASFPSVEELAQPEFRVAGIRWNPANFGGSRQSYFNGIQVRDIKTGAVRSVSGLPENLRGTNLSWSPGQESFAFLHYGNNRVDLYVVNITTASARRINGQPVNDVMGTAYGWQTDSSILYKAAANVNQSVPVQPKAPSGPVVQESLGKAAASRTYQDLIKSPYDEAVFEYYAGAQLYRVSLGKSGTEEKKLGEPAIFRSFSISPDKQYLLTATIRKPFSYLVPWSGFPTQYDVVNMEGKLVRTIASNPSSEGAPIGFDDVVTFPRNIDWRDDEPATIFYVQALDKGLGRTKSEFRDAVYTLGANGNEQPKELVRTKRRFRGIEWGNSETALLYEGMFADRKTRINLLNPLTGKADSLHERSSNDAYNELGTPVTTRNQYGRQVLQILKNGNILLTSSGASDKGDLPLLRSLNLKTRAVKELWRCQEGVYEYVVSVLDAEKGNFITRRESPTETPNYLLKNFMKPKTAAVALTSFTNPYPQLEGVSKEKISYKRADGIDLTATLYLPKGYDAKKDGPLPLLIWAYPREYKSAADAAQVRGSKYTFTGVSYGGPIFWATQGYAVMDNAEMPIVGEGSKEPNDNFIPQLYLNAHAAIQAAASRGVGDSTRVGVGGHSYGAFMTANLLAHTNLFKAGIARSGAYNRTLTPFGFQAEERTYWQAPEVYYNMSPFSFANKIKTPLLLIHGEMDNNSGTFPIQSERLYNAVKGHGGTARFITLPYESHGYAGKENILHMLWEQHQWLEKYVKKANEKKSF
ncbi:prolyl oligopeptidase family serine peptidase [Flavihumibacter stibioxidans]|uniref:Peptidase S9 n=1 Tax=Flavihumibacter stibioxidans TaxID=1834163 RepID=A0ABR7MBF4_9BACT|nr:prolyl oligopeptidase family serine peptidase [Flavihumibacter stibioxidans]MBC6492292.1 peptidase S9 [Flavihumibacter stibioxidans]